MISFTFDIHYLLSFKLVYIWNSLRYFAFINPSLRWYLKQHISAAARQIGHISVLRHRSCNVFGSLDLSKRY